MQNVWHKTSLKNNILGVDLDIVAMINTGYGVPSMYLSCHHHHIYIYEISMRGCGIWINGYGQINAYDRY